MKLTCGLSLALPVLLVLLLAVATKGHTVLQCYVCDNCEKVNKKLTPLEQCGGEDFSTTTTTTTTTMSTSSMSPSESTTMASSESVSTTTPMPQKDSTVSPSTEDPVTANTTIELVTLSTNSSTSSTTPLPAAVTTTTPAPLFVTPTQPSSRNISADSGLVLAPENVTWAFPVGDSSEVGLNRQRRHTEFNGITYYCYKIQKKYDNVFGTKRGCIGVKTNERPVCDELDMANNNQTKKCSACTTTMCNGSSTIGVSIATLLVALLAVIYKA